MNCELCCLYLWPLGFFSLLSLSLSLSLFPNGSHTAALLFGTFPQQSCPFISILTFIISSIFIALRLKTSTHLFQKREGGETKIKKKKKKKKKPKNLWIDPPSLVVNYRVHMKRHREFTQLTHIIEVEHLPDTVCPLLHFPTSFDLWFSFHSGIFLEFSYISIEYTQIKLILFAFNSNSPNE